MKGEEGWKLWNSMKESLADQNQRLIFNILINNYKFISWGHLPELEYFLDFSLLWAGMLKTRDKAV